MKTEFNKLMKPIISVRWFDSIAPASVAAPVVVNLVEIKRIRIAEQQKENAGINNLLDLLIQKLRLKNDCQLSRELLVSHSVISRLRVGNLPMSALVLLRMHEVSDISIRDLRMLMGDKDERLARLVKGRKC